jgi:hypothetical protein
MEQHCEKYKGMFKDQCYRITPKVLSGIEPGTVRAPRKILDAAIVETKTCKYAADCGSLFFSSFTSQALFFFHHSPPMHVETPAAIANTTGNSDRTLRLCCTDCCRHDYRKDAKKKKKVDCPPSSPPLAFLDVWHWALQAQKVDSSKAGCEGGGCSVHTKLAQIVVEGELKLRQKTVKAMDYGGKYGRATIPPIIHCECRRNLVAYVHICGALWHPAFDGPLLLPMLTHALFLHSYFIM